MEMVMVPEKQEGLGKAILLLRGKLCSSEGFLCKGTLHWLHETVS